MASLGSNSCALYICVLGKLIGASVGLIPRRGGQLIVPFLLGYAKFVKKCVPGRRKRCRPKKYIYS